MTSGATPASYAYASGSKSSSADRSSSKVLSALDALDEPVSKPKAKRQRKAKDPDAPKVEKRGARLKSSCPQNIKERVGRVISQRFYMIDRQRSGSELGEEFKVLGSTGNVYTVVIDRNPRCNCPDATKGNHCKHILFIYLKVLQVPQISPHWYQKALIGSELEEIFANAPAAPNAVANTRVRDAYAQASGRPLSSQASSSSNNGQNKRKPGPDDDCPVCYETMHNVQEKQLSYCEACGNCLHKDCFTQWAKSAKNGVTCVWCRAPWAQAGTPTRARAAGGNATTSEGYLNLSGVAGVSPVRDTSSYYQGPRRGQRHLGYQDYEDDWRF
ncbi:hypothetical protein SCHPADRAFT_825594 [Schizopora paradoxa]|uniref:SWIM-type domain-containing protein n=1 Tax=Schizopora paradoxa TaxID=27342 RepID=A0A0H2RTF4_9AGAM|nr:hypothetical protein SCHPADRAFT_825594 [Schizopora paradoxa]